MYRDSLRRTRSGSLSAALHPGQYSTRELNGRMNGRTRIRVPAFAAILALSCLGANGQSIGGPTWNPHTGPPAGAKYVGEKVCAECHVQEAKNFLKTPMAQAGQLAANAEVLQVYPLLKLKMGPFRYLIVRKGNQSIYSVTDGKKTISAPILWAFGKDVGGQTYILRHGGAYYQSRVSFFKALNGPSATYGAPKTPLQTLEDAFGERLDKVDAQSCIACHATGAVVGGVLQAEIFVPGVSCEACHGPGPATWPPCMKATGSSIYRQSFPGFRPTILMNSVDRATEPGNKLKKPRSSIFATFDFSPTGWKRASVGTQWIPESAALPATIHTILWWKKRAFTIPNASHAIWKRERQRRLTIRARHVPLPLTIALPATCLNMTCRAPILNLPIMISASYARAPTPVDSCPSESGSSRWLSPGLKMQIHRKLLQLLPSIPIFYFTSTI